MERTEEYDPTIDFGSAPILTILNCQLTRFQPLVSFRSPLCSGFYATHHLRFGRE
jgi:hypothetical protein